MNLCVCVYIQRLLSYAHIFVCAYGWQILDEWVVHKMSIRMMCKEVDCGLWTVFACVRVYVKIASGGYLGRCWR